MAILAKEKRHKEKKMKAIGEVVGTQLSIDYPRQGETITGEGYTFRISAPLDSRVVEVAVDQSDWRPCRQASGFWWFDWAGYESGEHQLVARLVTAEGRPISTEPHEFLVALARQPA